jgi:hypothetical protein
MLIPKNFPIVVIFLVGISAVSCNSSRSADEKMSQKNQKADKPYPSIPPPPGQADVNALVKDLSENASNITADISINEVLQYGASTPPLAAGTELNILIPKQSINNNKSKIKTGKIISLRISFSKGVNNNNWKFVMFINK